ncbi:MAG: protein kinase [Verrucomicrobia bacterium]|nr:protein kinase [Verrucomicrobiota bacterium]
MSAEQHVLALPAGYQLGKYLLKGVLGSGGFGITYLAEDTTLNRKVAVKEMLPNDFATRIDGTTVVAKTASEKANLEWARARFVDEGRALAACDHPNVVNVYEMIEANGTAYMVTKYEEGCSLERWLRDLGRTPSERELREILAPLLSGLERVHRAGFLHRDIKPDNIYLTTDGRPVLLDFGSARQAITSRSMVMTSIVSVGYAPFEQYHEDGNQGPWSDLYALGAVMYRAITGSKPPEAARRLQNDSCQNLATSYAGRYDARFLTAIDRALKVNESQRPQSVAEWRDMMGAEPVRVKGPVSPQLEKQSSHKDAGARKTFPKKVAVGAGALVLVAVGTWFFARPKQPILAEAKINQPADVGKQASGEQLNAKQEPRVDQTAGKEQPAGEKAAAKEQQPDGVKPAPKQQQVPVDEPAPREQQPPANQPAPKQQPSPADQAPPKEQQTPANQPAPKEPDVSDQPPPSQQQVPVEQPAPKGQQASADQPRPKEQESPPRQPAHSNESPSPEKNPAQEPSSDKPASAEEPLPDQVAIQPPRNGVEPQNTAPNQTPRSQTLPLPVISNPLNPSPTPEVAAVDVKLVGNWEGKPNGSKGGWDRQWEQQADGSYAVSGAVTETGNLTAGDGKIEKYLDGSLQPSEVLYKFVGNTLVTTDPDGTATVWRLVSGGASKPKATGAQTSGSPAKHIRHSSQSSSHSPGIMHEIRKYLPF